MNQVLKPHRIVNLISEAIYKSLQNYCEDTNRDMNEYVIQPLFESELIVFALTGRLEENDEHDYGEIFSYTIHKAKGEYIGTCVVAIPYRDVMSIIQKNDLDYIDTVFVYAYDQIDEFLDYAIENKDTMDRFNNREFN